ncbi:Fe3+-citrate ABC transporter substrate-binding protein [Vibrio anguillarum]|uniref:Fe3+-citrate ABC transporter substrate-binding protein n=3 Tax=Vibrio anguillarum TaxID=55601 RepID=UPI000BB4B1D1|nr:Fe3+-citrate ABC transporter substrate-binding protein [Vibrio anguillarum]ATC60197.1 Fe3+-citrate ABC transporter substrate-binding protein [Vibrio anguillarum]
MTKQSNYETNTGHRFISESDKCFKIHIHCPDDTVLHRSVGHKRLGKRKALRKAIAMRNELGSKMWGKHWRRVLKEEDLFTKLPHALEPRIIRKPKPTKSNPNNTKEYYIASWIEYVDGKKNHRSVLAAIDRYGKLGAYSKTKKALMEAHSDNLELLSFMGRNNMIKLM